MADRPIIFSAPMARALLDGRKTQTRRVIKGVRQDNCMVLRKATPKKMGIVTHVIDAPGTKLLPYAPGDRLWVREAFAKVGDIDDDIHACPDLRIHAYYRADAVDPERQRWRSPIHMPRWASRLTLNVTDVRVQRLQDISEADAIAEGAEATRVTEFHTLAMPSFIAGFQGLWNSLHGPGAWDANPWVVALTFTVQRGNIDQIGGANG